MIAVTKQIAPGTKNIELVKFDKIFPRLKETSISSRG